MITWDEFGQPGPIMIHDRSVVRDPNYNTFGEFQLLAREGDVVVPRVPLAEPLAAQARHFAALCAGKVPDQDRRGRARQGAEVVDILEASARSLAARGAQVEITYGDAAR
jgi:predicted dehydrogenase